MAFQSTLQHFGTIVTMNWYIYANIFSSYISLHHLHKVLSTNSITMEPARKTQHSRGKKWSYETFPGFRLADFHCKCGAITTCPDFLEVGAQVCCPSCGRHPNSESMIKNDFGLEKLPSPPRHLGETNHELEYGFICTSCGIVNGLVLAKGKLVRTNSPPPPPPPSRTKSFLSKLKFQGNNKTEGKGDGKDPSIFDGQSCWKCGKTCSNSCFLYSVPPQI
jgi:hypothetical protein